MTTMTCDEIRDLAPAYVLGALERDEELAVAEHLRTCPDAHAEMAELGGVVPYLDETVPLVEPPPALRDRIMAAAAQELASRPAAWTSVVASIPAVPSGPVEAPPATADLPRSIATPPSAGVSRPVEAPRLTEPARVIPISAARGRNLRTWALGIAAVFAIVAMGAWNVVLQQQLSDTRSYQQRLAAAMTQAGQPGSQVAVLASTGAPGSGPGGIAVMPASGNGTLIISGLAPTTGSQVYEAWSIVDGQPPTPVTGFTVGTDGVGYTNAMPAATGTTITVAITLEPAPNPTAPSSAPVAAGVAPAPRATS